MFGAHPKNRAYYKTKFLRANVMLMIWKNTLAYCTSLLHTTAKSVIVYTQEFYSVYLLKHNSQSIIRKQGFIGISFSHNKL
jgi:hypothetical protein